MTVTSVTGYQECSRCVMNNSVDPTIDFDRNGVCNHCRRYDELLSARVVSSSDLASGKDEIVKDIKRAGSGREYDCIIGVSGGVDSTYVAYLVKDAGLRPLAVHVDNGWNSELAVKNIERVLDKLGIDLFTEVLDWPEFRSLQVAFLRASTPDGEIPSDHAISAVLWREAARRGIRHIVSGMNFATESISVPDWAYGHSDWRYIKDVNRQFGSTKLRTYPHFSLPYLLYLNTIRRKKIVSLLNYTQYNKEQAMTLLQEELGWVYYGGKHHESIYTRFYQGYVLPKKFGIDKRVGHLSDLINAGQISREAALDELKRPPYPEDLQQEDLAYVVKKLGLSEAEFERIMGSPRRTFRDYRNSYAAVQFLRRSVNTMRRRGFYPK